MKRLLLGLVGAVSISSGAQALDIGCQLVDTAGNINHWLFAMTPHYWVERSYSKNGGDLRIPSRGAEPIWRIVRANQGRIVLQYGPDPAHAMIVSGDLAEEPAGIPMLPAVLGKEGDREPRAKGWCMPLRESFE